MEQYSEACIEACIDCMKACNHCFTKCLEESMQHHLSGCIRLDRECADICALAVKAMQTDSPFMKEICALCADICEACGTECGKHDHDHCQTCAKACFTCAEQCRSMAA
ncbi:four-helix bundle copper-binding protein [Bacillus subtilis]|uniref:four-helix bundle copper-binding protein n=1 Tax=Bacillus subtilis TaxID=1423 RepID=UPI001C250DCC|nr:four-helix bundle copper-binding protein [Bacillus subtilis]MBU8749760.1 four-helix bundle copper-binding protein [Bacillus subtilis]MBY0181808.1 four-helix bundle copper-binding protein [Bacillus subtilis]